MIFIAKSIVRFMLRITRACLTLGYNMMMHMAIFLRLPLLKVVLYDCKTSLSQVYTVRDQLSFGDKRIKVVLSKLNQAIRKFPTNPELHFILGSFQLNMLDERGYQTLKKYHLLNKQLLSLKQLDKLDIEFIAGSIFIGSLGNHWTLDSLIKAHQMGFRHKKNLIFLLPPKVKPRNISLFNYFSQYVSYIQCPIMIKKLSWLKKYLTLPLGELLPLKDDAFYLEIGDSLIQENWYQKYRRGLFNLTNEHKEKGQRILSNMGLSLGDWFVCLHVRQPGYRDGGTASENFRNANPMTYLDAIKYITEQGGWVIRLGDPSMTPLPEMHHVIDYAHSQFKSDEMDVFLCASCKFCIGTASGVYNISRLFGAPVLMTNCLPSKALYGLSSQHMIMPRLCRDRITKKVISFEKLFSPPISMTNNSAHFRWLELEWVENTKAELFNAVVDMLARLDGRLYLSKEDQELQTNFKNSSKNWGAKHGGNAKLHADLPISFLRKYQHLFDTSSTSDHNVETEASVNVQ